MANWIGNLYQQLLDSLDDAFDVRATNIQKQQKFHKLIAKLKLRIKISNKIRSISSFL